MYKMALRGTLNMQFLTPKFASVRDQSVRLHFSVAPQLTQGSGDNGSILVTAWDAEFNSYEDFAQPQYLTLEFFRATGWRKATGQFVIKRVNALAQNLNAPGTPQANAPADSMTKGYLADGSYIHPTPQNIGANGAFWGRGNPTDVQLYDPKANWQPWSDDASKTAKAGAYPARNSGAISYQSGFLYWEHDISLTAQ